MTFTIFINFNIFEPGLLTQFTIKLLSGKVMSYMDHAARLKVSVQKYTLFKHKKVTLSIAGTDFDYKPRDNFVFSENIAPRSCSTEKNRVLQVKRHIIQVNIFFQLIIKSSR